MQSPTEKGRDNQWSSQGRIQDFKLGGTPKKKSGRAEEGAKCFGVFRVKNQDFTQTKKS